MRGFQAPPPGIDANGARRDEIALTFTLQRQPNKTWAIAYSQHTLIAPGVPTHLRPSPPLRATYAARKATTSTRTANLKLDSDPLGSPNPE